MGVRWLAVANGPNILQLLLVEEIDIYTVQCSVLCFASYTYSTHFSAT